MITVFTELFNNRKIRFGLVGIGNTLLNFSVLNAAFYVLHQNKIVASIIATLCAVTVSFFLNRNFVFRHKTKSIRQPLLFAAVTLSGVLLVQNLVYALFVLILKDHTSVLAQAIQSLFGISLGDDFFDINISNFIASLFAMVWNYNGYRLFVFKDKTEDEAITLTT